MISATTTDTYVDLETGLVHAAILCDGLWETVCGIDICYSMLTEAQEDAGERLPPELQQVKFQHPQSELTCQGCREEIKKLFEN